MTCIVAVTDQIDVVMGADSGWDGEFGHKGSGLSVTGTMPEPKVHRTQVGLEAVVWGACGLWAACQHVERRVEWPTLHSGADTTEWVWAARDAIWSTFDALSDREWATMTDDDDESLVGMEILLGVRGRIVAFDGCGSVSTVSEDWAAIGSGSLPAAGSLFTTGEITCVNEDPAERVHLALQAATAVQVGIQQPYVILTTAAD